jgi:hypothetical protein
MQPDETILISGRVVAEFKDDASQFLGGEAEFVRAPETAAVVPLTSSVLPVNDAVQDRPGRDVEQSV